MRVAMIQMDMQLGKPEANFEKAEKLVRMAAELKPDVITLPETWNTGFFPRENLKEVSDVNLEQKACKATWNGQNLDAEVYRQITYSGDIVRLGFYETETFLYSVKGERCYSLDRNTYRWQDGGSRLGYSEPYSHMSCYFANGCLYQQDSKGKHRYLDDSFNPFYNVVDQGPYIPVDFTGEQIAGEIDGEELAGQYRIHMIVDPVDAAYKLAPYRATGNGLVTENQTVTSLTVEYHVQPMV